MEDRDERLGEQEEVGDRREARRIGGGGIQMRGEENRRRWETDERLEEQEEVRDRREERRTGGGGRQNRVE